MGKHQPYKNHKSFLITERSLNYILRPVQVRKENYPYTYHVENLGEDITVTVDRAWTPYNHLILDFVGHELHSRVYKNFDEKDRKTWENELSQSLLLEADKLLRYSEREINIKDELKPLIPRYKKYVELCELCGEWQVLYQQNKLSEDEDEKFRKYIQEREELLDELQYDLENLNKVKDLIFGDAIRSTQIEFKIATVLDRYQKFFINRRKEYIKDLLIKTSQVRFTFEYLLRVPKAGGIAVNDQGETIVKRIGPKPIKICNDNCFNAEIDGNVARVTFNTFLGSAYLHNILTLNTDWFEEDFLNLDGYASAIYRRFFVIRHDNKFDQLPIKELVDYFDFLKNCRYPVMIEKAFEDIKNAGLIHDYKIILNRGRFSKGYIEIIKSSK